MEKEYQRLEEERAGEEQSAEKSIADMATRMDELEAKMDASVERLEAKIEAKLDASQSRLEAMFQQILAARPPMSCTPPVSPRDTNPTVSIMLPILGDEARSGAKEKESSSPKRTPQVGGRASQSAADEVCASPKTHLQEMLASTGLDTAATEAGPTTSVAPEQPVQVLQI